MNNRVKLKRTLDLRWLTRGPIILQSYIHVGFKSSIHIRPRNSVKIQFVSLCRRKLREAKMEEGDSKSPANSEQIGNQLHHHHTTCKVHFLSSSIIPFLFVLKFEEKKNTWKIVINMMLLTIWTYLPIKM